MQFSLLFFASNDSTLLHNKYQFVLDSSKYADQNGFAAVWIPERHFHPFGGLFPNPAVLAAALAVSTQTIRLRAGSVVLPLHHPIRVAEEWSVVDNLSHGRVDIAFAQGWNAKDFVLVPQNYSIRLEHLFKNIELIKKLWSGEHLSLPDGNGDITNVKLYPSPQQSTLNIWITCSGDAQRFAEAGAIGANILTALLFQSLEQLADKIACYKQAREQHGFDPNTGHITLMLHTFIGSDLVKVKQIVKEPFIEYLKSSVNLWRQHMIKLDELAEDEQNDVLNYAFERYYSTSALIGTPHSCRDFVAKIKSAGVNEIACLMDFGISPTTLMENLPLLTELKIMTNINQMD